ncbi:amino acid decarboxylase [Streptomyces clavuligerus]|uniref:amino acid decarboxylase n=1 Tax=Streptomyces clavuligerus TaxID=1901 RepID=UPI00017FFABD|nr:amino acid decarboxylase [Streptomyces clavuligerus]ANW19435.1 amino acid decarboxylase [Streptomyces clavuligerus]AXU14042.1 Y4yA family PLP-dependent enzyme [Streptomyces clavuligerus]EDY49558.1 amino acid decarboxylase [Streptomyces clavuligerus]MBY6304023.1 Y4yA family PLP-dependent enzyme [Streptomyces clavuligerus]QCS06815.1 amino acid decarboxylase [Streptomyces clavuligerus]
MAVTLQSVLPGLPVLPDPATETVLASGLLEELSYAFGGPFHVLLPDAFDTNLAALRAVLTEAGVDGQVYFAKKANKAAVWVERCAEGGAGVDVASTGELREALGHGVRGEDLVVTGPVKSTELLRLAVRHGALIAVDALDELDTVVMTALNGRSRPARVLLRALPTGQPHSRFGLTGDELGLALQRSARAGKALRMEGFSFHLSGYDLTARAELAARLVRLCRQARALGLTADRISIGGGLPISYTDAESWRAFLAAQHSGHYHAGKSFTEADFYPYHSPVSGAGALRALLAARPDGQQQTLAELLRDSDTALLLEPGRALLDRAGATVFAIQGVKERDGYLLLTVDGTSLSLSEQWFASEYLPDPWLLSPDGGAAPGLHRAAVGAATCLESDLVSWRKIGFLQRPRAGDLLVYPNTAGYQMDSNESSFHDLPLPPKVVVDRTERPRPRWRLDRHFL